MSSSRFAIFVDLENCGAKVETLQNILEKVKIRGDILLGKVYGYTEQYGDLKEVLLSNTFTVVPSIRYGIAQKNNADIQLVIDALEVAFSNPLIDSFCIVSGDSDYTPLVGKLKSMGKFVLGISRSEAASKIFINACNEFQFLENVGKRNESKKKKISVDANGIMTDLELMKLIQDIIEQQTDKDELYASELKSILLRLRPDFNEKNHGGNTFGRVLSKLEKKYGVIRIRNDNFNVMISIAGKDNESDKEPVQINRDNWHEIFVSKLEQYKDDGFERINPSILKADLLSHYPDFNERTIGFKRFSDIMKELEKEGLLNVILDEQRTMLIEMK